MHTPNIKYNNERESTFIKKKDSPQGKKKYDIIPSKRTNAYFILGFVQITKISCNTYINSIPKKN